MFNSFFVSCFNTAFPPLSPATAQLQSHPCEDTLSKKDEVFHLPYSLDVTKANGIDGISSRMLKYTATSITPAVTKLFSLSITSGKFLQNGRIVPVPKNSDATSPSSYHPISLIPIISKVLERRVCNLIMDHLQLSTFISNRQWG